MNAEKTRDDKLAECIEEHYRCRARGEPEPQGGPFSKLTAEEQAEFQRLLATERALDALLEPGETALLPRPFGAYTLLREIGRGAMGVVYEALHRDLGRKVAIKLLRSGVDLDADARARFRREARSCAQVRHRNIVEIYEAGEHDGQPFYAMELVPGPSLADLARDRRIQDSRELFRGLAGVADALATLHAAGIVHRDVKPSNVIVAADGRMILADFGLARSLSAERLTTTGQALGTPLYMSPEQVIGNAAAIDGRSDIYSLGVTLYELLAGRGPFTADDPMAMLRMILRERPDSLGDAAPAVPADACAVVMKALEKDPADRYATAAAMRDDMLAHADGRAVEGRPVSPVRHAARSARRFLPVIAAVAALVGVALYFQATRPGRLTVTSIPPAELRVNGVARGSTPLTDLALAPGEHVIELVKPGWKSQPISVPVEAGGRQTFTLTMLPENADDVAALRLLGDAIGVQVRSWNAEQSRSSGDGDRVVAVFPRGKVRVSDLDRLRIDVADDFEPGGRIVFERRGAEIARVPFDPANLANELPFPADVRSALAAGDSVEWGYVAPSGARFVTRIEVVADDTAAEKLAAVNKLCGDDSALVRCHLATQVLLDVGLEYAAYRAASDAVREAPRSERAWAVMETALDGMSLTESPLRIAASKGRAAARDGR